MSTARLPGRPHTELVVVLDCRDHDRVGDFWAAALGYRYVAAPGSGSYASVLPPDDEPGFELLLQRVPEPKPGKNRLHLDLRVPDLEAEVVRLRALGARLETTEPIVESGWTWHILLDPEGNEFCALQPPDPDLL